MAIAYDTNSLKEAERFAYWRDVICDAYLPIRCETPVPRAFTGRIALDRFSTLDISQVSGSAQHVSRHRHDIARNSEAHFMLSVQLSHTANIRQGGRTALLRPGDFALYSTSEPYDIECPDGVDQLILKFPQDALLHRVPQADMLTGLRIGAGDGIGGMISTQIRQCATSIASQPDVVQRHLQDMLMDLVSTGLSTLPDVSYELSRPKKMLLARARAAIRLHLRDDALDRQFLADRMGMSARNLGRVFEAEGLSIAASIRQARLEAIADDLIDPRMMGATISQIAMKWGITNFQHLSKLFKQTYGVTPRDYRRQAAR